MAREGESRLASARSSQCVAVGGGRDRRSWRVMQAQQGDAVVYDRECREAFDRSVERGQMPVFETLCMVSHSVFELLDNQKSRCPPGSQVATRFPLLVRVPL